MGEPTKEWYFCDSPGEADYARNNGFGTPLAGIAPGSKVSCLVFTYEGFPDGGRALMGAVALKGVVVEERPERYVVKMGAESDPPTLERGDAVCRG